MCTRDTTAGLCVCVDQVYHERDDSGLLLAKDVEKGLVEANDSLRAFQGTHEGVACKNDNYPLQADDFARRAEVNVDFAAVQLDVAAVVEPDVAAVFEPDVAAVAEPNVVVIAAVVGVVDVAAVVAAYVATFSW